MFRTNLGKYLGLLLAVEEADPGGEELFFSDLRLKSNVSVLLGTLSSELTASKSRIRVSYLCSGNSSGISKNLPTYSKSNSFKRIGKFALMSPPRVH